MHTMEDDLYVYASNGNLKLKVLFPSFEKDAIKWCSRCVSVLKGCSQLTTQPASSPYPEDTERLR